jgi:hypothetical protein
VLLTNTQLKHIIDRASQTYEEIGETNKMAISGRSFSTYNLSKQKLVIKMTDDATPTDRLMLTNIVLSVIESD